MLALVPPLDVHVLERGDLGRLAPSPATAAGWFACSADGDLMPALDRAGLATSRDLTAETLAMAGVLPTDRVVVALNSDGAGVGVLWGEAASTVAEAACATGPRQPRRTLQIVERLGATTLVTTPRGARRLAAEARLAGIDPAQAGIRLVVLTGELGPPGTVGRVERDFDAEVGRVWADPLFGVGLASQPAGLTAVLATRPGLLTAATLPSRTQPTGGGALVEWLVRPDWLGGADDIRVRTGLVAPDDGPMLAAPRWTVGDHVLVRGRWLSVSAIAALLAPLVGPARWALVVARHAAEEAVEVHLDDRVALEVEPVARALQAGLPIHVDVGMEALADDLPSGTVVDRRGEHLGPRLPDERGTTVV